MATTAKNTKKKIPAIVLKKHTNLGSTVFFKTALNLTPDQMKQVQNGDFTFELKLVPVKKAKVAKGKK
jgi:hypothetical protein